jgi:glycosyltransferase involved in cell wall biosynthesis
MRLAFLSDGSAHDRSAWSGTVAQVFQALSRRFDVVPLEMPALRQASRVSRRLLLPTGIDLAWDPHSGQILGQYAARLAEQAGADAVFALANTAAAAALCERFPVFHCSDATFAAMIDYHEEFSRLSPWTRESGDALERRVITKSAAVILSSEWAARSAREDYGRTSGVTVVPFGSNLRTLPDRDVWTRSETCRLVFVGVNWHEKGADVAVDAARILNERGCPTVIDIVGCTPPEGAESPDFCHFRGFLNKRVSSDYERLTTLLGEADFFIFPTRFEAFGIAACEAAAFGTPAIARRTGGVTTVVEHDVTGMLIDPEAGPAAYADAILAVWSDPARHAQMRRSAFERAHRVLNWDAWGDRVEGIVEQALMARC